MIDVWYDCDAIAYSRVLDRVWDWQVIEEGMMSDGTYTINCVKRDIKNKEARGEDATYERELLAQWGKYPGWEEANDLPSAPDKVTSESGL